MLEQFLHLGAAAGNLSSFCLEPILALHDLFSKFNFYTSEHKSLILKYKEAKIKLFSHRKKFKGKKKTFRISINRMTLPNPA